MRKYCATQCSMGVLDILRVAGSRAGWCYEEAVGSSEILIVGDMLGESKKIRQATRLGVKIISVMDILASGLIFVEKQK